MNGKKLMNNTMLNPTTNVFKATLIDVFLISTKIDKDICNED